MTTYSGNLYVSNLFCLSVALMLLGVFVIILFFGFPETTPLIFSSYNLSLNHNCEYTYPMCICSSDPFLELGGGQFYGLSLRYV